MKKSIFFLLAVVLVAAFSCKRTDEVNPAPQTASQPNDSLKIQNMYLTATVIAGSYDHTDITVWDGPATTMTFNQPMGIFTLSDGSLLVADHLHGAIRQITTDNMVHTVLYRLPPPIDVAAISDGSIGVLFDDDIDVFVRGGGFGSLLAYRSADCKSCHFASIDKSAGNNSFLFAENYLSLFSPYSTLFSDDENLSHVAPAITIEYTSGTITSISVAKNDNKFIATTHRIFERTHAGVTFPILSSTRFTNLTSIIANHDGSKLYVADAGVIKLITRGPIFGPTLTTLLIKGAGAAYGLTLSNNEKVLYFTNQQHHTVNSVVLP